MHVVRRLELVDVAQDERERRLVALAAGDLGGELLLATATIRKAGELVGDRLECDRFVQSRVLERVRALRDKSACREQVVLAKLGGVQDQDSETGFAGRDRQLEGLGVVCECSDLDHRAVLADQYRAFGVRGLDGGRGDQGQELLLVVGRRQELAGAAERLPQAGPLQLELDHPGSQLISHRVEGAREIGELVAAANGHATIELAAADRLGGGRKLADPAHDRPTLRRRDRRQDQQASEQHVEETPPRGRSLSRYRVRRSQHGDLHLRLLAQRARGDCSVARSGHQDGQRPAGCEAVPVVARAGEEDDPVTVGEAAVGAQVPQ